MKNFLTRIKAVCLGSGWWRPVVFETDFQWCFSLCCNVLLDTYKYSVLYNLRCLQTTCIHSFSIDTITLKLQNPWVHFLTSEGQNKNSS